MVPRLVCYTLVPSALPGVLGFYPIPVSSVVPHLQAEIVLAAIMLSGVSVGIVVTAWRGVAASIVLLAFAALGVYLGVVSSDFGLFKPTCTSNHSLRRQWRSG